MKLPSHSHDVPTARAALAPYNFVPLPDKVVGAELPLPTHDSYHADRHTGHIACELTTASPLYVRCGYTPEEYADLSEKSYADMSLEERRKRAQFFSLADPKQPVIPGSSLRGMLRALVEIASFGKMEKVTDVPRFFFRAVAAQRDDPLAAPYKSQLRNVRAGYIEQRNGQWFIRPARAINGESFIKVREQDIPPTLGLIRLNSPNYKLQLIPVSFTTKRLKPSHRPPQGRTVVELIDKPGIHPESGWIVTSGNMTETGGVGQRSPRKNHAVVLSAGDGEWKIADKAVEDYRNGLSDYQIEQLGNNGVLESGRPVFYCEPPRGQNEVVYFGHSPNFRLPFRFPGSERAATPLDFVPQHLRDESIIDMAEAIFGTVRRSKQKGGQTQAIAGRVFVGDAHMDENQPDPFVSAEPITPQVLGGPKPTTFQHYLVQPASQQASLKHYGSAPDTETVVRGHKLYWHKGENPDYKLPAEQRDTNDTQKTSMRPVKPGIRFSFDIRFENLSDVELGALLWVLRIAGDNRYRLKLGMGKPLGMGAVSITHKVHLSNRTERYQSLLATDAWATGLHAMEAKYQDDCINDFEQYILSKSGEGEKKVTSLQDTLRIRCLLALLSWPGPHVHATRYMEIERNAVHPNGTQPGRENNGKVNEYSHRLVLPTPTQVLNDHPAPPPPAPLVELKKLDIGVEVTGNRKGEIRTPFGSGVRVDLNLKNFETPKGKTVIGFIRKADAAGSVSGGFSGIVDSIETTGSNVYVMLKPRAKEKK